MTLLPTRIAALAAALLAAPWLHAQANPSAAPAGALSRISQVTLYPGSATVERVARVAAGSRSYTFDCLPQGLDAASLQVGGDAGLRIGEIRVQLIDRDIAAGCASPLDERVRQAQDTLAEARAQTDALELAKSYLNTVAGTPPSTQTTGPGTPGAGNIGVTTEALRRSAQDTLVRLHQARRHQEQLERDLKALEAERERIAAPQAKVASVTVTLAAPRDAALRLTYQLRGPSWSPSYRAALDSRGATVQLERLALVAQNTGEDWSDVQLTLSTGQPLRHATPYLPRPWTLDLRPPAPERAKLMMAAPAPMAAARADVDTAGAAGETDASFEVAQADGAYASTFTPAQRITVPSGRERVTLTLQAQPLPAQLLVRTTPAQEAAAYLVAQLPMPEGVWPAGPVALYRDGAYVGQGRLDPGDEAQWSNGLAFGRDERVQVRAEPVRERSASAGLTGGRTERTIERSYEVQSRHDRTIALQVLDAAPVSLDAQISVESTYQPQPASTAWQKQPGAIAWQQDLAPGASARFTARHVLRHDKELQVRERR